MQLHCTKPGRAASPHQHTSGTLVNYYSRTTTPLNTDRTSATSPRTPRPRATSCATSAALSKLPIALLLACHAYPPLPAVTDASGDLALDGPADSYTPLPWSVTTIAGQAGVSGSSDALGTAALFNYPHGIAVDRAGDVYAADSANCTIRKISINGLVTTLAGSAGVSGSTDGTGSMARFNQPFGVAIDKYDNIYVADFGNHVVRKLSLSGSVSTLAGTPGTPGSLDGPGASARFTGPFGIAVDTNGVLYVSDQDTIRRILPTGAVTTLAGAPGMRGSDDGVGANARFQGPIGLAVDPSGIVYVSDQGNHTIRKITPNGTTNTVAGAAGIGGSADGLPSAARFNGPWGIASSADGRVYVSDESNHTIRAINSAGEVTTVAGAPLVAGTSDGAPSVARFRFPQGLAFDASGSLYIADTGNQTVRKLTYK